MFVCMDFVAVAAAAAAYFVVCVCVRVFVYSHQHSKQFPSHSIRLSIFCFRILKYCIELQALVSGRKDEQRIVLFMHSDFKCHTNENENEKKN